MKSRVAAFALYFGVAACSRLSAPDIPQSIGPEDTQALAGFKTIVQFDRTNGCNPYAGFVVKGTELYGTTTCGARFGNGAVYRVNALGRIRLVHSFGQDARYPYAPVTIAGDTIYGTGASGGTNDYGTVYSLTARGKERWVYSFKNVPDGASPYAGLVNVNGTFYGTTLAGGTGPSSGCPYSGPGCGTIFKISSSGKESVVYSFQGGNDGLRPSGGLVAVNGTLYGTTYEGGAHDFGTVFSMTTEGKERVLHAFSGGSDGGGPFASMIFADGKLYGTTQSGGNAGNNGVVFSITTSGHEQVVYSFGQSGGYDGRVPAAALTYFNGRLYGTTTEGGTAGFGTIFEVKLSGRERVLYSFQNGTDGGSPESQLAALANVLYGTTLFGGGPSGYGTVFALTPAR